MRRDTNGFAFPLFYLKIVSLKSCYLVCSKWYDLANLAEGRAEGFPGDRISRMGLTAGAIMDRQ